MAMKTETFTTTPGIVVGPNAANVPGALKRAVNAIILKHNVIEHRRGLRQYASGFVLPNRPVAVFQYKNVLMIGNKLSSAINWDANWDAGGFNANGTGPVALLAANAWNTAGSYSGATLTTASDTDYNCWAEMNQSCYIGWGNQVNKIDALAANSTYRAGLQRCPDLLLTAAVAASGYLAANASVAYRMIFGMLDANGNYVYGPPSGRMALTNGASIANVTVKGYIPADILSFPSAKQTSCFFQVYRTATQATADPGDEPQLVYQAYLTSTDISNKYVQFTDLYPEGINKGAFLYSNASQEGIAQANYQPPSCTDMASFKGAMWYSNTKQRARYSLTMLGIPSQYVISTGAGGITKSGGNGIYTLTAPTGTYDLTGIPTDGTAKLSVTGCTSAGNNGDFAITAVNNGAQTITVTNAGAVTEVGVAASRCMTATLNILGGTNRNYQATYAAESGTGWHVTVAGTAAQQIAATAQSLCRILTQDAITNSYDAVMCSSSGPDDAPGAMVLEQIYSVGYYSLTIQGKGVAFGQQWAPNIDVVRSASNDATPGRIYYSKHRQPEHVPLVNYFDIGSPTSPINRIVALRDSLLVFKSDGLFRIYGDGVNWSVSRFDDTIRLLNNQRLAVGKLGNRAFAITSVGLLEISEVGSVNIGGPVEALFKYFVDPSPHGSSSFLLTVNPVVTVSEREAAVYFYFSDNAWNSETAPGLTYNVRTNTWTQFNCDNQGFGSGQSTIINGILFTNLRNGQYGLYSEVLMGGALPSGTPFQIDMRTGSPYPGDRIGVEVTAVNAGTSQITVVKRAAPYNIFNNITVGSYVMSNNKEYRYYKVTAVTGGSTILTLAPIPNDTAADISLDFDLTSVTNRLAEVLLPTTMTIEYQPFSGGNDHTSKRWYEVAPQLDQLSDATSVTVGVYTETNTTEIDQVSPAAVIYDLRTAVDPEHQRSERISVVVKHTAAFEHIFLRGIGFVYSEDEFGRVL